MRGTRKDYSSAVFFSDPTVTAFKKALRADATADALAGVVAVFSGVLESVPESHLLSGIRPGLRELLAKGTGRITDDDLDYIRDGQRGMFSRTSKPPADEGDEERADAPHEPANGDAPADQPPQGDARDADPIRRAVVSVSGDSGVLSVEQMKRMTVAEYHRHFRDTAQKLPSSVHQSVVRWMQENRDAAATTTVYDALKGVPK